MSRAKLNELNQIVLDTLLERIKSGEKVNASLLSQAISFLKIHNLTNVENASIASEDESWGEEEIRSFLQSYPRSSTFSESEDAEQQS